MKLGAAQVRGFLARPDPKVAAALLYGSDRGQVRERAEALVGATVENINDPFNVSVLTGEALEADPARLSDEAGAMSLAGGRRVVWIKGAGRGLAGRLEEILETIVAASTLIVVEAGELGPRDRLRQLFETAGNAVALPCYLDEGGDLETVIRGILAEAGCAAEPAALAYLVDNLGSDRLLTRSELAKLALYKAGDPTPIRLDEAEACVGDGAPYLVDDAVLAAASGDQAALDRALRRCFQAGQSPVGILRAANRHFHRLHLAAGRIARGYAPEQALKALRPPVFFKQRPVFLGQLRQWSPARLAQAFEVLLEAESQCKSTGMPEQAVLSRALMRIAQAARAGGSRA